MRRWPPYSSTFFAASSRPTQWGALLHRFYSQLCEQPRGLVTAQEAVCVAVVQLEFRRDLLVLILLEPHVGVAVYDFLLKRGLALVECCEDLIFRRVRPHAQHIVV